MSDKKIPSKSFFTRVMENARDKQSNESASSDITSFEAENSRYNKVAMFAAAGCAALVTAAILISNNVDDKKAAEAGITID